MITVLLLLGVNPITVNKYIIPYHVISYIKTLLQIPGVLQITGYFYKIWYIIKIPETLLKTLWYYYKNEMGWACGAYG